MLWANYGAQATNKKLVKKDKKPISLPWVTFWGVFPDLFAFGITFITIIPSIISGNFTGRPSGMGLPAELYQYSHSIVIWAIIFAISWLIWKKPQLALFGWALHILIDIPSHSGTFYPTPFLFPISDWKFQYGVSWANPTYMIINYTLLLIVSLYIFRMNRKKISK